ncbi:MAG: FG-GAP repeat protein, partial [Alphaproteobacteria bacterium]|nr:FG-GAP repeat protein [Alphaproteobacteria bacterium]
MHYMRITAGLAFLATAFALHAFGDPGGIINLGLTPEGGDNTSLRIFGAAAEDRLGSDLGNGIAYGDINGDGFDDIVVGAPLADPGGRVDAGAAYIVFGDPANASELDLNNAADLEAITRIEGDDESDQCGWAVASGDMNDDGFDDVVVGAWRATGTAGAGSGEVYVIYGRADIAGSVIDLNDSPGTHNETRILGEAAIDRLGWAVASGDFNADGFDDLLLGAPWAERSEGSEAGRAYVLYGSGALPGSFIELTAPPGTQGETRVSGAAHEDRFAFAVAAGDVNGDGYDDALLGAYQATTESGTGSGECFVVYG